MYIYTHMYEYKRTHTYIYIYIHTHMRSIYIYVYTYAQYHTPTTPQGGEGDTTTPPPHHRGGGGTVLWLTHDHSRGGGRGLERWTIYGKIKSVPNHQPDMDMKFAVVVDCCSNCPGLCIGRVSSKMKNVFVWSDSMIPSGPCIYIYAYTHTYIYI